MNLDLDYLLEVRKYAVKIGVRIINRVGLVDVLTDGGRCAGAVGYRIEDGTQYIFNAKAVVLDTGSQNFRNAPMWASGRGEGIAVAWRVGTERTSCEFATFYQWSTMEYFEPITLSDFDMYAADGTCIAKGHRTKYDPDVDSGTLCEWYIQNKKGNGPIRYLARMPISARAGHRPDLPRCRPIPGYAGVQRHCQQGRYRGYAPVHWRDGPHQGGQRLHELHPRPVLCR